MLLVRRPDQLPSDLCYLAVQLNDFDVILLKERRNSRFGSRIVVLTKMGHLCERESRNPDFYPPLDRPPDDLLARVP